MIHSCPACHKPLVSGFSPLCNYCGAAIPASLRFTAAEKHAIEAEEQKAKQLLEEREAERIKKAKEAWEAIARAQFYH